MNVLHLQGRDAQALCELFQNLTYIPIEGASTARIDDEVIRQLLSDPVMLSSYNLDFDVIRRIVEHDASATDVVAAAGRRAAVVRFRQLLKDRAFFESERERLGLRGDEAVWQRLFEEHPWILGVGLADQLLISWNENRLEQVVSGHSIAQSGKRADAVLRTAGAIQSLVFAEIKTAQTPLLEKNPYRPDVWAPSKDLVAGVSQVQATVNAATQDLGSRVSHTDKDGVEIPNAWTYLYQPRSFLIAGSLGELISDNGAHNPMKFRSFELYRRNILAPEIITFDELLARAEWVADMSSREPLGT